MRAKREVGDHNPEAVGQELNPPPVVPWMHSETRQED